ncbi:MAG TPA: glycosyl hydrolase family 28-related protein [Verrucomicrobiae bacterium]|nr:glycosyl hydrolase family 28-related protein [Verrucomicrobiae bacterium]
MSFFSLLAVLSSASAAPGNTFNVRDYGAAGDGVTLDTAAINQAIQQCSQSGGGQVLVPAGRYLSGTIHLMNHVTLFLAAGSTLLGATNLDLYQQPQVPSFMPEAKWGKWHRGLIVGENLQDIAIAGFGTIDGHKVFDPTGEEHMRGPHAIVLVNVRGFSLRDLSIVDAANYAVFFEASDDVDIRNVKIAGGWDGVHFRGAPKRWCHHVSIIGCQFYTGDDSIAGRYWDNVLISGCVLNSSCNGIRLIGPATRLIVDRCLFYGPGQRPHRTGGRTNMLSGIILQPGAWDRTEGLLDDVLLSGNTMHDVASPVTIWTKPGNPVNRITISGLNATGVYRSALSVESWSDAPITNLVVRDASIEFAGGGTQRQGLESVKKPGADARRLPAWGLYARNVQHLTVEDVRLSVAADDVRPVLMADRVEQLTLDNFRFTPVPGVKEPMALSRVAHLTVRDAQPTAN